MTAASAPARSSRQPVRLWAITSRTIVFGAVGAALYGVLGALSIPIAGTLVGIRPAVAIIPFVGLRFGPIAGFFAGFVGNAIVDQISGAGFLTYWNWSIANGLVGLIAGLLGGIIREADRVGVQLLRAAGIAIIATVVAFLFTLTDILVSGSTIEASGTLYGLVILSNVITVAILVPVLDQAWKPLQNIAGR
jgi:energy-coupling factor transport system substrate-specific component